MNNKELKPNANTVGVAPLGDPHFKEITKNTPTPNSNPNSKIHTLASDHSAITLIALVITIIVMLILVGVSVSIAINGGLFSTAKKATADTQANIDAEQRLASGRIKVDGKWYNSLEDYTKGIESSDQNDEPSKWAQDAEENITYDGKPSEIKIGDYVNYKPETKTTTYESSKLGENYTGSSSNDSDGLTTDSLNWRVLGVDENGCLTLISDKPTTKAVFFWGATGYNNGVYILNDICERLYSNTKLGIKARSITIEDIEAGFSDDGKKAREDYTSSGNVKYGKTNESPYSSSKQYPIIYKEENGSGIDSTTVKSGGIGESVPYYNETQLTQKTENKESDTATSNLTCIQTYYYFENTPENYCKNEKFYEMIFETTSNYWLASRYVNCDSNYAGFGLRRVNYANLLGSDLFNSGGNAGNYGIYLRPVVSLGFNISIETVDNNSDTNPHKIPGVK